MHGEKIRQKSIYRSIDVMMAMHLSIFIDLLNINYLLTQLINKN